MTVEAGVPAPTVMRIRVIIGDHPYDHPHQLTS
jgi:hypothetical protein